MVRYNKGPVDTTQLVFAVLILALGVVVVVEGIKALSAKNNAVKEEAAK